VNANIEIAGWTLVHFVWQGTLLWIVAAAALRLLATALASVRYGVACAALAAMLAAPIITALSLSSMSGGTSRTTESTTVAPSTAAITDDERPVAPLGSAVQTIRDAAPPLEPPQDQLLRGIVFAWLVGIAVLGGRLAGGWWRVRRLHIVAIATGQQSTWEPLARRLAARLQLTRHIHVVDSGDVDSPVVLGWLRPVVVLPVAALAALTPEQVAAILAHELAHVRRHDFAVNLLQSIVEIVLFYHPAVWWISRQVRIEREHCCDAIAVSLCGDPIAYCEALTELESRRASRQALALAATGGSLLDRIQRVLGEPPRRSWAGASSAALALTVLLAAAGGASYLRAAPPEPVEAREDFGVRKLANASWPVTFVYPGGEYRMIGFSGRSLVATAYDLPDARVIGAGRWVDETPFELSVVLDHKPEDAEIAAVLRRELEMQLGLRAHTTRRQFPAYALALADGVTTGANLRPATRECVDVEAWAAGPKTRPLNLRQGQATRICRQWDATLTGGSVASVTMASFARELQSTFRGAFGDRDLVDRTGLRATYDIDLEFFLPAMMLMEWSPVADMALYLAGFRSLPDVLEEQLGLTIQETTAPYDTVVIDQIERPTGR
jgi:uncharacterized protein (TIGR03435 family)